LAGYIAGIVHVASDEVRENIATSNCADAEEFGGAGIWAGEGVD